MDFVLEFIFYIKTIMEIRLSNLSCVILGSIDINFYHFDGKILFEEAFCCIYESLHFVV